MKIGRKPSNPQCHLCPASFDGTHVAAFAAGWIRTGNPKRFRCPQGRIGRSIGKGRPRKEKPAKVAKMARVAWVAKPRVKRERQRVAAAAISDSAVREMLKRLRGEPTVEVAYE